MLKIKLRKLKLRIVRVYKGWKLSTKLFIILSLMAISLFIGLQWQNFKVSQKIIEDQQTNESRILTMRTNQYLNTYYENIKTILLMISSQKNLLNNSNLNSDLHNYVTYSPQLIKTLYVVTDDSQVFCSNAVVYNILGNGAISKICDTAKNGYNGIQFEGPYYTSISSNTVAFFIPVRENNVYKGVVIAEASLDSLYQNLLSCISNKKQSFLVTSQENIPVCYDQDSGILPYENGKYPREVDSRFQNTLKNMSQGTQVLRYGGKDYVLVKSLENSLGWNSYIILSREIYSENLQKIFFSFLLSIALGMVFILLLTFMISFYFTNPIRTLAAKMDALKMLDHLPVMDMDRNDEIGHLVKSYNSMMSRINELVEQRKVAENNKKEYEFKMLQSQIAPHFLYNTLACIGSLARQHREAEIGETIRSLVGLLSFSFDKRMEFVTLEEELGGLQMYIGIQRMRYGDIFEVKTDAPDEALGCTIPKLTLQPLIENALFHGIVPMQKNGCIWIRARLKDGIMRIIIRDNGIGCSEIQAGTQDKPQGFGVHDRFNHIGLSNINERIKLYFGEEYGLKIRGKKNVGTVVKLKIPIRRQTPAG